MRRLWLALLVPVFAAAALLPAATLSGTVTDADGAPVAAANVSIAGTALGAATDDAGRFTISGADAGTVDVRVTAVGFAPRTQHGIVLRDGESARLDVRLERADVEVVVADERSSGDAIGMSVAPPPSPVMSGAPSSAPSTGVAGDAPMRSREAAESSSSDAVGEARADDEARPASPGRVPPRRREQPRAGVLTAGDIDDGLNWDAFLRYASRAEQRGSSLRAPRLDDRLTLRIVDRDGRPVAGARVRIDASTRRGLTTEAGTDGRLALFPRYDFGQSVSRLDVRVTAPDGSGERTETVDVSRQRGDTDRTIRLRTRAERPQALDLAIVLDVTGSMGDEHRYLTDEFENIVGQARRRYPDADLRFALVAYRDHGDQFVVRRWDFTRSEREMRQRLQQLSAGGGGDMPEAMDEALDAMLDLDWRTGTAARIAFLVADAPPHAQRMDETLAAVREARARGLRLYPLAASGVDATAEHLLRTAAVLTQGRYLWLTDDSGVGNAHGEPNVPCYDVQTVDRLVARVIESELAGRRVEADPQDVVRSVGNPIAGVCQPEAAQQQQPRRRAGGLGYD